MSASPLVVMMMASMGVIFHAQGIVVGSSGTNGWRPDFDYTYWVKDKTFQVGDQLVFNYDNVRHDVCKVDESVYNGCMTRKARGCGTKGQDRIPILKGCQYFICSHQLFCADHGMKIKVCSNKN